MRRRGYSIRSVWPPLLVGILLLIAWHLLGVQLTADLRGALNADEVAGLRKVMLPLPMEVVEAAWMEKSALLPAAASTSLSAALGFVAAAAGGYGIALVLASSRRTRDALLPWVLVLQMTPIVVLAPILAIWLKEPPLAPVVAVTFLIGFFPVVANSLVGLETVSRGHHELFRVSGATRWQYFIHLQIPGSIPSFLTGLKVAGTLAPIGAIAGDLFLGTAEGYPGLGYLTVLYRQTANTPALMATAAVACLVGFAFVAAVHLVHWLWLREWHELYVAKQD